jgi:membrane-bound lytic murein transglycosylase D
MRATGSVYGLRVTRHVEERRNPAQATAAAAHHLRDLYQRFGDWALAMAAYNMGYEQLLNRIDRYGTSDFNELSRQRALPSETAGYVPKIVAAALVANNLERYGFVDVKMYKPLHTAELTVPGGTPLKTLAKAAGVSRGTLRKLNPHLLRDYVPPGDNYTVYVPPATLSRTRAALPAMLDQRMALSDADILAPDVELGFDRDRKKRSRHRTWDEGENLLRFLPKPKRRREKKRRRALRSGSYGAVGDQAVEGLAAEFGPRRGDREVVMYRVGRGDTLIGVAREFAIDIDDLARDNGLDGEARLREGALLRLRVKRSVLEGRLKNTHQKKKNATRDGDSADTRKTKPPTKKKAASKSAA